MQFGPHNFTEPNQNPLLSAIGRTRQASTGALDKTGQSSSQHMKSGMQVSRTAIITGLGGQTAKN